MDNIKTRRFFIIISMNYFSTSFFIWNVFFHQNINLSNAEIIRDFVELLKQEKYPERIVSGMG